MIVHGLSEYFEIWIAARSVDDFTNFISCLLSDRSCISQAQELYSSLNFLLPEKGNRN